MKTYFIIGMVTFFNLFLNSCQTDGGAQQKEEKKEQTQTKTGDDPAAKPKYRVVSGVSGQLPPVLFNEKLTDTGKKNIIDLRTPQEIAETGKIAGAQNIDFNAGNLDAEFGKLSKNEPVMVYCAKGGRSHEAYNMLRKMGFTRVYELQGGMDAWLDAGLSVDKSK